MGDLTHIYGLVDPTAREIFYIGRSHDPDFRLRQHISEARIPTNPRPQSVRIREILGRGETPNIVILETVEKNVAHHAEEYWIRAFRHTGYLCNQRVICAIPHDASGPRKPVSVVQNPYGPRGALSDMTAAEMREERERLGWSKAELARRLGVTAGAVTRWESGQRGIPLPTAQLLRSW